MFFKSVVVSIAVLTTVMLIPRQAAAADGAFEISFGFNFSRSNYTDNNFTWSRRWGTSFGYHFNDRSEVEFSFQDNTDRNHIVGYEDTTYHDRVYSINWVQALTGKNAVVQPYVKIGVGQLNREATGTYAGGASPPSVVDSVTGVLGAGTRIYITKAFALRIEATSYLAGGSIGTWDDNFGVAFGASFYF
jgi:hypothetical protein